MFSLSSMKIEVTKDAFRTVVNGKMFVDFKHRTDFRKGKFLVLREGADYYDVIHQQRAVSSLYLFIYILESQRVMKNNLCMIAIRIKRLFHFFIPSLND